MDDLKVDNHEAEDETVPLHRNNARRQRQQLRFSEEEEEKPEKPPSSFIPPGRASRFLSIADPSIRLPGSILSRLRQLHSKAKNNKDSFNFEDISDEVLDTMPFKYD